MVKPKAFAASYAADRLKEVLAAWNGGVWSLP
jgi:hypothetical protein